MAVRTSDRLAVLIDAENAQASVFQFLLAEIGRYGTATTRRAYGDWTADQLNSWRDLLPVHAVQPIHHYQYTNGKNSSDTALIIDAMDLLHSGRFDGFCLVSSDSDFTRLAMRIRESGLAVYGFGERKTPSPFVNACDKFIYTEILRPETPNTTSPKGKDLEVLLRAAVEASQQEDGWALLSHVGSTIQKMDPSFDSRNYGCSQLSDLARSQSYLKIRSVPNAAGTHEVLSARLSD